MADLGALIDLTRISETRYESTNHHRMIHGGKALYGGLLVAQAILASFYFVPRDFIPLSVHCLFMVGGDNAIKTQYEVERLRKGSNFAHLLVRAYQKDKELFTMQIIYRRDLGKQPDTLHRKDNLGPVDRSHLEDAGTLCRRDLLSNRENLQAVSAFFETDKGLNNILEGFDNTSSEYRLPGDFFLREGLRDVLRYAVRCQEEVVTDPSLRFPEGGRMTPQNDSRYNYVMFGFFSDAYLLATVPYFVGLPVFSCRLSVSLDHDIRFHGMPKMNEWLDVVVRNISIVNHSESMTGDWYDSTSGEIVCSVSQQGLAIYPTPERLSKL
ncbi:ACL122Wp [Eremothecium gossypii ATCC 10895]|uniref:ACL122Wp n=1 Tax=Eremothecium gossypii (strain ATCC 10895 / CBS 109.51 / FGSC 9923 / NRRL Y-1056) TaxID=284811 RepID=Q75CP1_EREGS|nr:ACL122Wp [Eremothecium gossypii ATCC 10895]AAS51106.1 ACL122Wp [Eremothecium gossypii ATCC 10895]AEY95396.1 FACL122Wp [Eremothecium gossypii FDAG1]